MSANNNPGQKLYNIISELSDNKMLDKHLNNEFRIESFYVKVDDKIYVLEKYQELRPKFDAGSRGSYLYGLTVRDKNNDEIVDLRTTHFGSSIDLIQNKQRVYSEEEKNKLLDLISIDKVVEKCKEAIQNFKPAEPEKNFVPTEYDIKHNKDFVEKLHNQIKMLKGKNMLTETINEHSIVSSYEIKLENKTYTFSTSRDKTPNWKEFTSPNDNPLSLTIKDEKTQETIILTALSPSDSLYIKQNESYNFKPKADDLKSFNLDNVFEACNEKIKVANNVANIVDNFRKPDISPGHKTFLNYFK